MKAVIIFLLLVSCLQMVTSKQRETTLKASKSCATSSVNGKQILRGGKIRYCQDGWTVFQKRFDGSLDFHQNWKNYKNGFGNMNREFWLGLQNIYRLTRSKHCRLRIDLWDFDDNHKFATYRSFSVMSGRKKYQLHISGYKGTAGDGLSLRSNDYHNNMPFTTYDRDNDMDPGSNCAVSYGQGQGGWWFKHCFCSALNAVWGRSQGYGQNIQWQGGWKGEYEALKATTMKLRCD